MTARDPEKLTPEEKALIDEGLKLLAGMTNEQLREFIDYFGSIEGEILPPSASPLSDS